MATTHVPNIAVEAFEEVENYNGLILLNMEQRYSTEIRRSPDNTEYVKVLFLDNHDISEYKILLDTCIDIRKVNVTKSESNAHKGDTLTVYPKPMIDGKSLKNRLRLY